MTAGSAPLARRPLRTPREHGAVLIEPPSGELPALIEANLNLRRRADCDVQGRTLQSLATDGRRELAELAFRYTSSYRQASEPRSSDRVFIAGHQPELFHPGVWAKNFALGRLGRDHRAVAVNLVIDSDTIKHVSLRVPGGSREAPIVESLAFDAASDEIPYEERDIEDRNMLAGFGARARGMDPTNCP